ncbi:MAG: hypothetical protein NUW37_08410 [Planctomycetes bacterium]|nr:hypothetical protein [Planctomycetota bacterium]
MMVSKFSISALIALFCLVLASGCATTARFERSMKVVYESETRNSRITLINDTHPDYQATRTIQGEALQNLTAEDLTSSRASAGSTLYTEPISRIRNEKMEELLAVMLDCIFWEHAREIDDPYTEMMLLRVDPRFKRSYITLEVDGRRGTILRVVPPPPDTAEGRAVAEMVQTTQAIVQKISEVSRETTEPMAFTGANVVENLESGRQGLTITTGEGEAENSPVFRGGVQTSNPQARGNQPSQNQAPQNASGQPGSSDQGSSGPSFR